jgi:N6-adenosine-specific RNA methylase IME4
MKKVDFDPTTWPLAPLEPGVFDFIMADPPWRFKVHCRETGLKKSADRHYPTMKLDEIRALPVSALAAKNCVLWLWCTSPMLKLQIDLMEAWGFRFVTQGQWVKRTKKGKLGFGGGFVLRSASEPFVIGKRGHPKTTKSVRNIIEGPLREHSRKPEEAYAAAESMMPSARRADLFGRQLRPGWDVWGNERDKFSP